MTMKTIAVITAAALAIFPPFLLHSYSGTIILPSVSAQKQQRLLDSGAGSILPGNIPTLFSFEVTKAGQRALGHFECFAVMPDGKTMYMNGTVTGLIYLLTGIQLQSQVNPSLQVWVLVAAPLKQ
jgi:hypothetical protein